MKHISRHETLTEVLGGRRYAEAGPPVVGAAVLASSSVAKVVTVAERAQDRDRAFVQPALAAAVPPGRAVGTRDVGEVRRLRDHHQAQQHHQPHPATPLLYPISLV